MNCRQQIALILCLLKIQGMVHVKLSVSLLNNGALHLEVTLELKKKLSNFHSKNPQTKQTAFRLRLEMDSPVKSQEDNI